MKIQSTRGRLLASTMICGVLTMGYAGHAFAADEAANKDSGNEVTEVVVTGSRLQRKDFTAISPVTTVGSEQLEMTGTVAVEQLVNELPQIVPGNTVTSNNSGGEDFATVDLRGLGPQRTLVVVNGERVPGSSTTGVVDLNTIPAGLIDRIEVLTGGASAVYGSDAMSGVVNFILKQNYEGAEVSALVGGNFHGQGKEFNLEGILGGNFANGRGNMTTYASFFQRNRVLQSEFDWSKTSAGAFYDSASNGYVIDSAAKWEAVNLAHGATITGGVENAKIFTFLGGGSGTPPWGWITNNTSNPFTNLSSLGSQFTNANTDCLASTPGVVVNTGNLSFNDAGQLTPRFTSKACAVPDRAAGSSRYNYAPTNDIIIPAKRYAISTFAHYDITDNITLKTQLSFVDSQSGVQLAATPATGLTVVLTPAMVQYISANHPDLKAALDSRPNKTANFTEDWRSLQLGPRIGEFDNQSLSLLATVDGKINDNWNWSVTASYGQTRFAETLRNNLNKTAIEQGLTGCQVPIADSQVAGSPNPGQGTSLGVTKLPGCVITDIFGQNKLSAAAVTFLRTDTHQLNIYTEQRVAGFIRGDILQLPAGGLSTVFGFEYREDHASLDVDDAQRAGDIYGFNAIQNQKGAVTVKEGYLEVGVPLIKDAPFAQYLGLEGGYRWSDYDTIGSTETYKIGGEWSPVSWLKFRAVYNKAVRAPSVFELFQNGDQGFPSFVDPCNHNTSNPVDPVTHLPAPTAASININNICHAQAPTVDFTTYQQNNSQIQAFAFGNPNLKPETGKTQTYGLVFQPDFLPVGRLKASVDYYDIQILDAVASVGAQTISSRCIASGSAASANCLLIQRDPVTGQVLGINTSIGNLSELRTKGWDVQIDFKVDLGDLFSGAPGRLSVNELYSYLSSFKQDGVEGRGQTGASIGSAFPDYKSVLTVNYGVGDWLVQARWSYVPEMVQSTAASYGVLVAKAPAASYVDTSVRWNVTDNFQLTGTVNNLFDKEPPQLFDGLFGGQGNTDPQVYRVLGRTFTVAAKVRF